MTDQSIHVEQIKADLENRRNLRNHHDWRTLTTPAKALNEGFADYFYEMTRDYYSRSGTNYVPDIWDYIMKTCGTICPIDTTSNVPSGGGNEARISSFLYQYTTKLIAPYNGMGNTAAFGVVRDSIKDTGTFNQGFYDVWNSYFKKSYTSLNSGYLNPCTTGTVVNKTYAVSCLLTKMTLTEQAVILP